MKAKKTVRTEKRPAPGSGRNELALYLIELLVSIAVAALVSAALVEGLADCERISSQGQCQILAAAMAQEQIDNARNSSYADLAALVGSTQTLQVNKIDTTSGPSLNPRPLLMDQMNLVWTPAAITNEFQGTATETVDIANVPGLPAAMLKVTVTVSWKEGGNTRTYSQSTLIAPNGIHN